MTPLTTLEIGLEASPAETWQRLAAAVAGWGAARGLPLRDVVVLVPFTSLIEPARRAFAAQGGWMPRVETTQTLQRSLGPPHPVPPQAMTGNAVTDALLMAQLLRAGAGLGPWERRDPKGFGQAVADTVDSAHRLAAAAAQRPPAAREAFWDEARSRLAGAGGPGAPGELNAALARTALEWARMAPPPDSDALWRLAVAGWVVVRSGGADALAEAVVAQADACGVPALLVDTDPDPERPWAEAAATDPPRLVLADGLEDEARSTAAEVLAALQAGRAPVALIALDRVLMRRVRALLERRAVALADETGWALSTTRAAARLMAMLRAARAGAGADERLEWLKSLPAQRLPAEAVECLEAHWRAGRASADVAEAVPDPAMADALGRALGGLVPLGPGGGARRRPLSGWLDAAGAVLAASGLAEALRSDAAGQQVLVVLGLAPGAVRSPPGAAALAAEVTDLDGFAAWVDGVLEGASFIAQAPARPQVVLTPLGRAILRPFGAVVLAGADEARLGAGEAVRSLLGPVAERSLGMPTADERLQRERAAFVQLLRTRAVTVVRRRTEGDEPVAESPFIAALSLARERAGSGPLSAGRATLPRRSVVATPVHRPAPSAADRLPAELSATAVERLRACPYRFFARSLLGLGEAEELAREADKRELGIWLHDLLHRFHRDREPGADDEAALRRAAEDALAMLNHDAAAMLPYRASFERLLPAYLAWLHGRDGAGWQWSGGEQRAVREAPELGGMRLVGRIDRIDRHGMVNGDRVGTDRGDSAGHREPGAVELIDYKTGRADTFRQLLRRNRFEDTQLAFYALLVHADAGGGSDVRACYLPLDGAGPIEAVVHRDVAGSARALLSGLAHDLARLRAGAGMPALGEGRVCETCESRGLCRRDHWHGPAESAP